MSYLVTASALPLRLGGRAPCGREQGPWTAARLSVPQGPSELSPHPQSNEQPVKACASGCGFVFVDCQEGGRPRWAAKSRGEWLWGCGEGSELCPRAVQSDTLSPGSPTRCYLNAHWRSPRGPVSCCGARPLSVALKFNFESAPKVYHCTILYTVPAICVKYTSVALASVALLAPIFTF